MNTTAARRPPSNAQRGVASLVIVAILVAVMAIGVVFTNRNLILEQRTSANQYRSTVAAVAAEAGLEWVTAMMNKQETIGTACTNATGAGTSRFRLRYFDVDANTGTMTPKAATNSIHVACVANTNGSAGWVCSCPVAGTAANPAAAAPASGYQPSFAIAFSASTTTGTLNVVSYGCTGKITGTACGSDAAYRVAVTLGPVSSLGTPPTAPLTARGTVNIGNAALGVSNGDPTTNGITINAGLGIDANSVRITTVPGTPPKTTLVGNDPSLRTTTEEGMFATFFGMDKATYKDLAYVVDCGGGCGEGDVAAAYATGARAIWFDGNVTMNANVTIGSPSDPFVMIIDGSVEMRGDIEIYGVLYSTGITWDNTGGGSALLQGAAISEGNYTGNGTPDYVYDPRIMSLLRATPAAYGRVPGSWRDFGI
jgi:Tfp pilus assembly protein PilX